MTKFSGNIEDKILLELKNIGFNLNLIGTTYIKEAISIINYSYDQENVSLDSKIYPKISKKYFKSEHNIKNSISYAINELYNMNNSKTIQKYFYLQDNSHATPTIVIYSILHKIKRNS